MRRTHGIYRSARTSADPERQQHRRRHPLNLGGLALTQVNATSTTGSYTVRYDTANPQDDGGTATYQFGTGNLDMAGCSTAI